MKQFLPAFIIYILHSAITLDMNRQKAAERMNVLGRRHKPFVFLVDFEMLHIKVWEIDSIPDNFLFKFDHHSNFKESDSDNTHSLSLKTIPPDKSDYISAFDEVMKEIYYGNTFLLNLTGRTEIKTDLDLEQIFAVSQSRYKLLLRNQFVCYSPETFVKIKDGFIHSYPMKGTIDARLPNAEQIILEDAKEKAEHNTIVDLIRNDISRYAHGVHVPRFRYVEKITNKNAPLLQVSSEIKGSLTENYQSQLGDIIFSMLPAGSVSGAPKPKTIEIIQKVEKIPRGYYTGIAGFYDGKDLDSCVLIRYIEQQGDRFFYRSGGGITFQSDAEKEYQEMLDKIYVPTY